MQQIWTWRVVDSIQKDVQDSKTHMNTNEQSNERPKIYDAFDRLIKINDYRMMSEEDIKFLDPKFVLKTARDSSQLLDHYRFSPA